MGSRGGRANEDREGSKVVEMERKALRHRVRNPPSIWRRNKVVEGQTRMREPYCEQERMGGVAVRHGGSPKNALSKCFSLEY